MWCKTGVLAVLLMAGSLTAVVAAETTAPEKSTAKPEAIAAAHELFAVMDIGKMMDNAITKMVDVQVKQNPMIAPVKTVMLDFFRKYMSWDVLKDEMAKIYAEEFTIKELKELTAFYKSPLGQKMAQKMPVLMAKGAELGQRRVQEHMPELQAAIMAEMAKQKGGQGAGAEPEEK
jgi:hypothetical protein